MPVSSFDGAAPGIVNAVLSVLFSWERHLIDRIPFPIGVSLLATARIGTKS